MPPKAKLSVRTFADPLFRTRVSDYAPKTLDAEKRTVDMVVATEFPVTLYDWGRGETVDEVLAMGGLRPLSESIPLLDAHNRSSCRHVLGSLVAPRIGDNDVTLRAEFSALAQPEFTKVQEGHLRKASAGYNVHAYTYIEAGKTAKIAGKSFSAKGRTLAVASDWELLEGSLVPVPADPHAGVRSAAGNPPQEAIPMDPRIRALLEAAGLPTDADEGAANAFLETMDPEKIRQALNPAPAKPAVVPPAPPAPMAPAPMDPVAAVRAELERRDEIANSAKPYEADAKVRELRDAAVREKKTLDQFRAALLDHLAGTALPPSRVTVGREDREVRREGAVLGLMLRAAPHLVKERAQLDQARAFYEHTLFDLARRTLEDNGVSTRGLTDRIELFRRALAHTTGDFPYALENTARKVLLAEFALAPATWSQWCSRGEFSDFKPVRRVRGSEAGIIPEVPEGADSPEHTIAEGRETLTPATYSEIFSVTMQALVNDDVGLFKRVPSMHARAWAGTINQLAVKVLLTNAALTDTVALFHGTHNNLDTSTTAVTTVATAAAVVRSLRLKLQKQTDVAGTRILGLVAKVLLCSPTLQQYHEQAVYETGRADSNVGVDIKRLGLLVLPEAELENTGLTGYGANLTYLFAAPEAAPVVELSFLNGNEAPRLTSEEGFQMSGMRFKVEGYAMAGAVDFRGGAKHVL